MSSVSHPRAARGASSVHSRWRSAPPVQIRSQATMERFAEAAEELLRTKPFEDISIQEIVRRAGRPTGSFYARFGSKEALLPFLYERYHDGLESVFVTRLARVDWGTLDFEATVAAIVDFLIALYDERRWLVRALALFTRTRPEALPPDLVQRRRRVYDHVVRILARYESRIAHADAKAAIRFGVFLVSSVAREKLLFGETPHSRVTPLSRTQLREELVRALSSYLASEAPR